MLHSDDVISTIWYNDMLKVQPFAQHVYPPLFAISYISVLYYSPCMRRRDCRLVPYHSIESQQNWKITCRRHGLNRESKLQFYLNALVHIFYYPNIYSTHSPIPINGPFIRFSFVFWSHWKIRWKCISFPKHSNWSITRFRRILNKMGINMFPLHHSSLCQNLNTYPVRSPR